MVLSLGLLLVTGALAIIVWHQGRWNVTMAFALAIAGIVVIAWRPCPKPIEPNYDKVEHLCKAVALPLFTVDTRTSRTIDPARVKHWKSVRWTVKQSLDLCTVTQYECARILDEADPSARDFHWRLEYVRQAISETRVCAEKLPPDPYGR